MAVRWRGRSGGNAFKSAQGAPLRLWAGAGPNPDDIYNHAHGSYVTLAFKDYVPELTAAQVKELLAPVLDFKAETAAEAYEKSLPPKLQQAVKEHRALVGMDREMVTYAKGRPPRRIRERDGATEYEEWIYGQPPAEVEFIRFVGETVIRIETMKVDGEKIVRTEPEVDLRSEISSMAGKTSAQPAAGNSAPSLLRPGETPPQSKWDGRGVRPVRRLGVGRRQLRPGCRSRASRPARCQTSRTSRAAAVGRRSMAKQSPIAYLEREQLQPASLPSDSADIGRLSPIPKFSASR